MQYSIKIAINIYYLCVIRDGNKKRHLFNKNSYYKAYIFVNLFLIFVKNMQSKFISKSIEFCEQFTVFSLS